MFRCTKEKSTEIVIKDLNQKVPLVIEPTVDYKVPVYIHVFEDHSILLAFYGMVNLYDENGEEIYELQNVYGNSATVSDGKLYVINGNTYTMNCYDAKTGNKEKDIPIEHIVDLKRMNASNCGILTVGEDQAIYYQNSKGIHKLLKDGSVWNTILDGALYSICPDDFQAGLRSYR